MCPSYTVGLGIITLPLIECQMCPSYTIGLGIITVPLFLIGCQMCPSYTIGLGIITLPLIECQMCQSNGVNVCIFYVECSQYKKKIRHKQMKMETHQRI